jgi:signal transduction histidine kinase
MAIRGTSTSTSLQNPTISVLGADKLMNESKGLCRLMKKRDSAAYAINVVTEVQHALLSCQNVGQHRLEEDFLISAGQMVYGIAHDVRHYLCCLVANVEMLYDAKPLHPSEAEFVEEFHEVVQEICLLFELPMASAVGKSACAMRMEQLSDLVEQAIRRVRCHPIGKGVDVSFECPLLPRQCVNRATLISAIFNLALNACKAVGDGGEVSVGVTDAGSQIVISVADNGPGLPDSVRDSFLRSFGAQRTSGGFGLGLSIAARTAAEHGGVLCIEDSRPGRTVLALHIPKAVIGASAAEN